MECMEDAWLSCVRDGVSRAFVVAAKLGVRAGSCFLVVANQERESSGLRILWYAIRTWRFKWRFRQCETSFVRIAPENKSDIKHRNGEQTLDINEILKHVDHTLLSPQATWDEIRQICDDAVKYHTASVCIPPSYVKQASKYLGERVKVCTVIASLTDIRPLR